MEKLNYCSTLPLLQSPMSYDPLKLLLKILVHIFFVETIKFFTGFFEYNVQKNRIYLKNNVLCLYCHFLISLMQSELENEPKMVFKMQTSQLDKLHFIYSTPDLT